MSVPPKTEYSLLSMVGGCKLGIPSWQKRLYERYFGFALAVCLRYTASREEALEMVNDGFVKVFRGIAHFREPDDPELLSRIFMSWLKKIMIHTSINHYQSAKRKADGIDSRPELPEAATPGNAVDDMAYLDLIKLIQRLSPAYRATFSLFAIEGFSHEEIAKTLGISVGTSKTNLMKARKNLREMLEQLNE
ncbi:RNA polymerase sigma factor [Niabella drilacis]|uniref:RNA polymerase sigma-70 factor, ECF subfamily n=1 Tax=Niabella drilacis (strain DSM 25811 / CCM 8410 / CCUG 62505 / LMG 26954 / E90) TaxID=1285928 RepID=A0A1G6YRX2_NIADE|nr:sigma-70 family RNA polymerase sigma factor [Niabella drilacis]SDD93118.1 RNA polymerase sigma-70 factor, ECF subfamily [Niabella drilacis]